LKKSELIKLCERLLGEYESTTVLYAEKQNSAELHPSIKPQGLLAPLIVNSSKKGWNVLDLFGGSGSTLIACEQTGRKCFMMELDPHYVDVIIKRWEDFTGQKAELIQGVD
jgi:site-specific DNA-methyltransferase (adenine-specific)